MSDRHTNLLIFQLLKLLSSRRDSVVTFDEVKETLLLNESEFLDLMKAVENNARIEINMDCFRFRPLFKFSNVQELESGLRNRFPEGIKYEDIRNEVPFLDLQASSGDYVVLEIKNNCHMIFFNGMPIPKVDRDLRDLWNSVIIPDKHNQNFF